MKCNTTRQRKVNQRATYINQKFQLRHRFQGFYAKEMHLLTFQNTLKFDIVKAPKNLQTELINLQSYKVYEK